MPTGYTARLAEGEQSFEEFVWQCARAFGALILMRDDDLDAPVPERFEPHSWHVERREQAEARLNYLLAMTGSQVAEAAREDHAQALERWEQRRAETAAQKARYLDMLGQVLHWEAPTQEHTELQRFMIQQLESSIKADCYEWERPQEQDPQEWWTAQVAKARRDIEYHTEKYAEEVKRTEDRNAWIAALRESVPQPKR